MLSQVKLIAEPWDVGPGGYQVGNFPILWSEWNGIYRDTMRDFWRGRAVGRRLRLALRRLGRPLRERRPAAVRVDQLHHRARRLHAARPRLVQREAQRGERRGEPRRHRRQPLLELRRRRPDRRPGGRSRCARASSATSCRRCCSRRACRCCSAATSSAARRAATTTPGARTTRSRGSTGTSCDEELLAFTRRLIELRHAHPVFRRTKFFEGKGEQLPDVWWFRPDGRRMTRRDWDNGDARAIGVVPERRRARHRRRSRGEPVRDDSFLLLFNAHHEEIAFRLPARRFGTRWELELSTGRVRRRAAAAGRRRHRRVAVGRAPPACAELRATYRLQLTPDFGFAEARAARAVPARPRHLASLPLAVAAGARRLAARLRRRRPAPRLGRARRRGRVPQARDLPGSA